MSSGGRTWSFKSTESDTILTAILIQRIRRRSHFHFSQNPALFVFLDASTSTYAKVHWFWENEKKNRWINRHYVVIFLYANSFLAVIIKVISFLVPRLGSEFITRPHQFLHDRKCNWNEVSANITYDAQELLLIHFREMHTSQ